MSRTEPGAPVQFVDAFASYWRWLRLGLSTEPIDRPRALAAVRKAYACADEAPPERVVWATSPRAGATWDYVWREAAHPCRPAGDGTAGAQGPAAHAGAASSFQVVRRMLGMSRYAGPEPESAPGFRGVERIASLVVGQLADPLDGPSVGARGSLDAGILFMLRPKDTGQADRSIRPYHLDGLFDTVRECGFWWPFERGVIIADRPELIALDRAGLPHSDEGMAIRYRDGWGVYSWHGVRVPTTIALAPDQLTAAQIDAQEDEQLRRVCIERLGLDRYMKDSGARLLDEQFVNERPVKLWRREFPSREPLVAVEVVNATPEPDGHHKRHWLRVPPQMLRARSALAWTFGLDAREYNPAVET